MPPSDTFIKARLGSFFGWQAYPRHWFPFQTPSSKHVLGRFLGWQLASIASPLVPPSDTFIKARAIRAQFLHVSARGSELHGSLVPCRYDFHRSFRKPRFLWSECVRLVVAPGYQDSGDLRVLLCQFLYIRCLGLWAFDCSIRTGSWRWFRFCMVSMFHPCGGAMPPEVASF